MIEKEKAIRLTLFQINLIERVIGELTDRISSSIMSKYEFENCIQERMENLKSRNLLINQLQILTLIDSPLDWVSLQKKNQ